MIQFVELVIPIQNSWLNMLDRVALPVIQMLAEGTPYFLTNDQGKVMRLRLEQTAFENAKQEVYSFLISQLQSAEKVKIYKQIYALEEARFGKVTNINLHTNLFHAASDLIIRLLEEAEHIDVYENRIPYAVIATYYLLNELNTTEAQALCFLYIKHWMFFNEQNDFTELMTYFESTYEEEALSMRELIEGLHSSADLVELFNGWSQRGQEFLEACAQPSTVDQMGKRQKAYFYQSNTLENPRVWENIADHIHLLYNRFGMENEDETLLIYLTMKAMRLS